MQKPVEITSPVSGTLWQIDTAIGAKVLCGETLFVIESMKMEIPVDAPRDGTIVSLLVSEKDVVKDGQALAILE